MNETNANEKMYKCWYCNGSGRWFRAIEPPIKENGILFMNCVETPCPECKGAKELPESKMPRIVIKMMEEEARLSETDRLLEIADELVFKIQHYMPVINPEKMIEIITLADEYAEERQKE